MKALPKIHKQNIPIRPVIKENNFMEIKKNPTNKYKREIKQLIKSSPKIFQNNNEGTINTGIHQNSSQNLRNKIAYGLTNNNPSPPFMKGLPKIHKQNIPRRPVINCINSPYYKVSKFITKILKEKINLKNKFTVKQTHLN